MSSFDHVEYLEILQKDCGKGKLCFPKAEGAFYWYSEMTHDEYTDKYREECIKLELIEAIV